MKAAGKAALAIGIIGVVAVAGPYVIGLRIESAFRAGIASLSEQSPYPIRISRYERGIYSAEAETAIEVVLPPDARAHEQGHEDEAPAAPKVLQLRLHHAISHGPRLDGLLRLGRLVTTPQLDDALKTSLAPLFGEQSLITLTTDLGFTGGISGSLRSPAVDASTAGVNALKVRWAGIESSYAMGGGHLVLQLAAPNLDITGNDGKQGSFGQLAMSADMTQVDDSPLWIGTSTITVASLALKSAEVTSTLNQFALNSDTRLADGSINSGVQFSATRFEAAGTRIDQPRLSVSFDHLDTAATIAMSTAANRYQQTHGKDAAVDPAAMMAELKPAFSQLAAGHPELRVDELSFGSPAGAVKAEGSLRYIGDANFDDFSPLTDVEGHAQFDAPLDYVNLLLSQKIRADLAGNAGVAPAEVPQEVIASALQNTRDALIAQGLLLVDGQQAKSAMAFKGGVLTINGKTLGTGTPGG